MRSLDKMLQCGQSVKVFYNNGNPNNCIRHIRGIVDGDYIVFRTWRKGNWHYHVTHRYDFEYKYEKGRLS